MELLVLLIFIIGYIAITLEHPIRMDKTIPAVIMGALCWAVIAIFGLEVFEIGDGLESLKIKLASDPTFNAQLAKEGITDPIDKEKAIHTESVLHAVSHHIKGIAEILVFLIGAMTIVEIIDLHKGFNIIKQYITTRSKRKLLWIVAILAFILSAIIDNLTTTIVLITILRKLIPDKETRMWYIGVIVIAANAGGAWSPIGDVTTTMLWISHKVTSMKLIEYVFLPSIICILLPLFILQFKNVFNGKIPFDKYEDTTIYKNSALMLYVGIGMIVFVPIFKSITHLPPYLGMIFSLGVVWLVAELASAGNFKKGMTLLEELNEEEKRIKKKEFIEEMNALSVHKALSRIEMSSILFFLGILLAVGALESLGYLYHFADVLNKTFSMELMVILLGFGSAVIDNVPLVAACLGMYQNETDSMLWHFVAFSAGTGGSMLIIGSAAGVAAMGMEKISFGWYLKNFSWLALIGFLAGCLLFILFGQLGFYPSS